MAFFPANSSYPGMLGEMYSAAFTAPAFNWLCSPAVTELETVVLDWICQMFALPKCYLSTSEGGGGGVIQGSASEAIVTVMVAARERIIRRRTEKLAEGKEKEEAVMKLRASLVALGSEHAHSSTQKGAIIAGTRFRSIACPYEDGFSMTGSTLRHQLEKCKEEGLEPFYVTVTLGSTATCAVDKFEEIKEVVKDYPDLWIHVDAAYAGAALVCEEYQHLAQPFDAFDSFNMNMHKWLLTNFDCSVLFVKHRRDLTDTLSITPSYLRNQHSDAGLVTDYRDWQIPLGRRFRSLKVWFVLRTYGIKGLQDFVRGHIKMGEYFASLIKSRPDLFRILTGPSFALTVFTVIPPSQRKRLQQTSASKPDPSHEAYLNDFTPDAKDQGLIDANRVTKDVYEKVNEGGEIFITSSVICGVYAIRIVSANVMASEKYLKNAFDILVRTAEEVLDGKVVGNGEITNGTVANGS